LCKRKKRKGKGVFSFSFSGVWIDREVRNDISPFSYFRSLPQFVASYKQENIYQKHRGA